MIGNRIRLARQANCLSLQQLAERISACDFSITKTALFNYEAGRTIPNQQMISALVHVLGIKEPFYHLPDWTTFNPQIQGQCEIASARLQELLAYMQIEIERFLTVSKKIGIPYSAHLPKKFPVSISEPQKIEAAAIALRNMWGIGKYAIPSVSNLLESNGWILFSLPEIFNQNHISGVEISSGLLFMFSTPEPFLDSRRENMLRELGKHILEYPPNEEFLILDFFARALLFPKESVIYEFGHHRTHLRSEEMGCVKQKYGLSRRNIVKRLKDCDIISNEYYREYKLRIQQSHHLLRETPANTLLNFFEEPTTVYMCLQQAKAEGLISESNGLGYDFVY